ncbi:MAG: lysine--tRNA ligase [Patescibacteria group bacterium]|nr:lysine--tRNA ligase [Patescibacteria group bacterium]
MKESLNQIIGFRLDKLKKLREKGIDPYPAKSSRSAEMAEFLDKFASFKRSKKTVSLTGRLMSKREFGGLAFGVLKDFSGEVQVVFKKDLLKNAYADLELIDVGDILQVSGQAFVTKKGEKSCLVKKMTLLAKSLRPLPEKWHGLTDQETRFRQRYLDILFNDEVKRRFILRHQLVQAIRKFLIGRGFIEVDTPALQPLPGGALATPFKTHYEALDTDVYLRIAPELYLKRLMVGGFEKVFEFARVFRNEGVSTQHLQDFTMLEFYQAYTTHEDLMRMTELMLGQVIKQVLGTTKVKFGTKDINFKTPWPKKTFRELIKKETGLDIDQYPTAQDLTKAIGAKKIKLTFKGKAGRGKLIDELYKETVRPKLVDPVFLVDHPLDLSPLAKKKTDDPTKVQRFQLVIAGMEVVNAFSELNDPIDQKERFMEQARQKKAGDKDAHSMDDDFVKTLEYGMPPTAGWGMGIERLLMLLTNADSAREAVLFPFVKDK